jgi:ElaB/YqjD/DUF883 family membrane-anchored ribosome-binding protein
MFNSVTNPGTSTPDPTNRLVDQAALSADNAIKSTQRVANEALDSLAGGVEGLRHQAAPVLNRVGEQASTLAYRGVDAVREGSQKLRDRAVQASDNTVAYIKDEPVKSMLIAAATGAALMALVSLIGRSQSRG